MTPRNAAAVGALAGVSGTAASIGGPFLALGYAVAAPVRRHLRTERLRRAVLAFSALAGASLLLRALIS